ncbi:uncharacterized protein LOC110855266 [Folsomia candida]|nr:uncharacterized protein LOC110855266 [Folsomia candida]
MEKEIDNQIPFLDIMVYKKEHGEPGHKIYRKPTHTNQYLHFDSYHHPSQKIAVIDTLVTRAMRLCDEDHRDEEMKFVTHILQENHYPLAKIKQRIEHLKQKTQNNPEERRWIALPYTGSMAKRFSKLLGNNLEINIGYFTGTKLSTQLYNFKDKKEKPNSGIYKIKCKACPLTYIGESERNIERRLEEHEAHVRHGRVNLSAVALHMAENPGHEIDKASFKLIERETRFYHRKIKEALHMKKNPSSMNIKDGRKINPIWLPTILPLIKNP